MNNIIKRKWNKNSMVTIEDMRGMTFQAESGGHTFQISGVDGEGNAVALSGTPAGVLLRSDNQDVTLTCSISDGKVNATLPANAYSVPGRFGITIFLTSDGQKTAIYAAVGTVGKTSSGTVAPPAGSDVVDLVNRISAAIAAIPASYNSCFAPVYSTSGLYSVGQYVTYDGKLYRCNTQITTAETWTAAHWTQTNLGADVYDLKSALTSNVEYLSDKTYNILDLTKQIDRSATVEILSPNTVKVTAKNADTYNHGMFAIPVTGISQVKITFSTGTTTGSARVRLGYSSDGETHGGWIDTVTSGDVFDVSSYDYIVLALYATWTTNTGTGKYATYENVMVVVGDDAKEYLPGRLPKTSLETVDIRTGYDGTVYASAGEAVRKQTESNHVASEDNNKLLHDGFEIIENIVYGNLQWDNLQPVFSGDNLVVEAPSTTTGNTYVSSQLKIPVDGIHYLTISYEGITGDSGTNARIRYGHIINDVQTWDGFTDGTTVIDCTGYDAIRVAFYAYYNKPATAGGKAYFNKVQIETGDIAHAFVKEPTVIGVKAGETGNTVYFGERVNVGVLTDSHRCDIETWKNFTSVSQYELHNNQSIAIYGGYGFLFQNGGGVVVFDYATKEIIATMSLDVSSNHQNSAQFTDIFFSDGDEFPLVIISRCGNSKTTSPSPLPGTDGCIVCRITRTGTTFSITLVNLIALDISTFGSSWGYDRVNHRLCMESYINGTYEVTANNPIVIYTFDMPTKEEIMSGHQITLNVADAIDRCIFHHYTAQGLAMFGNYIYAAGEYSDGHWIYVIDTSRGIIVSKIPLPTDFEPEGVCIYDSMIFASARQGTDTSGTNPCKIYSISV